MTLQQAVPLKLDDSIRIGTIRRQGIDLSQPGKVFVESVQSKISQSLGKAKRS